MLSRILNSISFYYKSYQPRKNTKFSNKSPEQNEQIRWSQLISLCSINNQKLINAILKNNEAYLTNQLFKKSDNSLLQSEQSDFPYALIVMAIKFSNIANEKVFMRRFMEAFLGRTLVKLKNSNKKQIDGEPLFKSDIPIIAQNKDQMLKNLIKIFSQSYREKLFTEKSQTSSKYMIIQFLNTYKEDINSYECLRQAIDCLDCVVEKSFTDSLKLSSLLSYFLTKIKKIFESDSRYTKNLRNSLNEKNISTYSHFNILAKTKKIKLIDRNLLKYFVDIICAQDFLDPERSHQHQMKVIIFYSRCLQSCSQYYDPLTKSYPLVQKYKKTLHTYLTNSSLQLSPSQFQQLHLQQNLSTILQIKYHHSFCELKSQLINNYLIIREKPQIPKLDQIQVLLMRTLWDRTKNSQHWISRVYVIGKKFYGDVLGGLGGQKGVNFAKNDVQVKFTHNQFMHRTCQALQILKIRYSKEEKIEELERSVDILLQDEYANIIIECDGDYHIDYATLNLNPKTSERNMQLLLLGYKLIIINIYQFNINRDINSMVNILKEKLEIMKNHNAIYVS